jgi:hypothetical protein
MKRLVYFVMAGACVLLAFCLRLSITRVSADAVVTDGRFTNVYVFPDPSRETWEQHLNNLPASMKPDGWQKFTRQSIDAFTQTLMSPAWPSYFGALHQYGGINPPRFFGSHVASQECVDAALKDANKGVIEATTIRSLANCHQAGKDPSPQVNLIFSPDMKIGEPPALPTGAANGPDICGETGRHAIAFHWWGLNTPNFAALPTARGCAGNFEQFTSSFSHEVVEILSDPGQLAHGGAGGTELGDQCESSNINWNGFTVQRYRSDNDNICWPLNFPPNSSTTTWVLAEGSPTTRFTGDVHTLTLNVPGRRLVTAARATEVQIWIQTGGDDLRGGNDNADVTLTFLGGSTLTRNINGGREWGNGQTHIARLTLPAVAPPVQDIQSVTITTHFGGGIGGDNWNVDKVALMVGFPTGSATSEPTPTVVHTWLDKSGGPLIRFTGSTHDLVEGVASQDNGKTVTALDLIISTGNDDLRGGGSAGDNCNVTIELNNGTSIAAHNVNGGGTWNNWTDHTVKIPLPSGGLRGGDVKSVRLHTGFGGGIGGDNWNVQRIQLKATLR